MGHNVSKLAKLLFLLRIPGLGLRPAAALCLAIFCHQTIHYIASNKTQALFYSLVLLCVLLYSNKAVFLFQAINSNSHKEVLRFFSHKDHNQNLNLDQI